MSAKRFLQIVQTAIIMAAQAGHSQVVQALVAAGAQLDVRDYEVRLFSSLVCSSVGELVFLCSWIFFLSLSRCCASVCRCHCLSVCVRFACPPVLPSACFVCGVLDVFCSRGLPLCRTPQRCLLRQPSVTKKFWRCSSTARLI